MIKKKLLSVLAAIVLSNISYAGGTIETLYFVGDDLKTGMKYLNSRDEYGGTKSFLIEENYNKNKMSYIKPDNYQWQKQKDAGKMKDKLVFPDTTNYAFLERINLKEDTYLQKSKYEKDELFIILDGGACIGDTCNNDEIITSVIVPKKFSIVGYEAHEKRNKEYKYNEDANFKLIDNTLTLYSKDVQGAYVKLWFKDISTSSSIYEDVSRSLEKFSEISVSKSETETTILMPMDNVFDSGKATAKPIGKQWLKTLADALQDKNFKEIRVEGHTDNTPIKGVYPSNWELSSARASDAVRFMIANGVSPDKISAVGYADTRPIADNNSKENKAKNRRIEITIIGNPDDEETNGIDSEQPEASVENSKTKTEETVNKTEPSEIEPVQKENKVETTNSDFKNVNNGHECDAIGGKWEWNGTINEWQCL